MMGAFNPLAFEKTDIFNVLRGEMLSFKSVIQSHEWRAIPGCPGRYVLSDGRSYLTPSQLLGTSLKTHELSSPHALDRILVTPLIGGGLISYQKPDLAYVHTLGNEDGFLRKLQQLGISMGELL